MVNLLLRIGTNMKNILLFLWQLPQNLIGYCLTRKNCKLLYIQGVPVYYKDKFFRSGISLGKYIILDKRKYGSTMTVRHEKGHQRQSLYLGWLYLVLIGIPSLLGNCRDRLFHRKWDPYRRYKWYYQQPWEYWADYLGGVKRTYN